MKEAVAAIMKGIVLHQHITNSMGNKLVSQERLRKPKEECKPKYQSKRRRSLHQQELKTCSKSDIEGIHVYELMFSFM